MQRKNTTNPIYSVRRLCAWCGREFMANKYIVAKGRGRYCGSVCAGYGTNQQQALGKRFWRRVARSTPDACWPWQGMRSPKGYGLIKESGDAAGRRKALFAHRVAWELTNGPIPDGLRVCHKCDNPPCVNPAHLFTGTDADNIHDMMSKGRYVFHARPEARPRGERVSASKLTEQQVREIRALDTTGEWTRAALARRYGMSESGIRWVTKGRGWKHVA